MPFLEASGQQSLCIHVLARTVVCSRFLLNTWGTAECKLAWRSASFAVFWAKCCGSYCTISLWQQHLGNVSRYLCHMPFTTLTEEEGFFAILPRTVFRILCHYCLFHVGGQCLNIFNVLVHYGALVCFVIMCECRILNAAKIWGAFSITLQFAMLKKIYCWASCSN